MCFIEGLTDQEILRKEMVAQLCMGDKTHSQLVDLISFNEKTLMMQCSSTWFACSWKFDVDNVFYQVLAKKILLICSLIKPFCYNYTQTFTQQNSVIGWFLVTCPWSNSNVSRPGYNCAVVAHAPNTTACFCHMIVKGKFKYITKHLMYGPSRN